MKLNKIFWLFLLAACSLWASHEDPPKVLEVKKTVGRIEQSGTAITLYTRLFGLDTPEGVNELYSRFRIYDRDTVAAADRSQIPKRALEFTKTKGYQRLYGKGVTITGECFIITGPSHRIITEEGNTKRVSNQENLQKLLEIAETNYVNTTEKLLVGEFMDWSDYPAHIYIIPDPKMWLRLRVPESAEYISAAYCVQDVSREFFILDDGTCPEYINQTLGYAVSEQILKEYYRVLSGKPDAKIPLFLHLGIAAESGNLEATLVPPTFAPFQVPEVTIGQKVKKIKRPNPGIMLPLRRSRLIPFEELKEAKELPQTPEGKYVFLREARGVANKLWEGSPLGMLALLRALAQGRSFDKEFCLSYVEMQRGIIGTEVKENTSTNVVIIGEAELKGLDKASNRLFYEMTQEKMTADLEKAKKEKEKAKAEGKTAQPPAPTDADALPPASDTAKQAEAAPAAENNAPDAAPAKEEKTSESAPAENATPSEAAPKN